jgi:hypothetical protein
LILSSGFMRAKTTQRPHRCCQRAGIARRLK